MSRAVSSLLIAALGALALCAATPAAAQPGIHRPDPEAVERWTPEEPKNPAHEYFTDVELINQHGEPMRLYSDLLEDRVVVINTIYTTCTGICPPMSKAYERFQEHLGEKLGSEVHLISITVDPETDTPEKMKRWGEAFHAKTGWYLLTGPEENVRFALSKLGQYVEDKESHQALMLMGNDRTKLWKKTFGLANPEELIEILDTVLTDDGG